MGFRLFACLGGFVAVGSGGFTGLFRWFAIFSCALVVLLKQLPPFLVVVWGGFPSFRVLRWLCCSGLWRFHWSFGVVCHVFVCFGGFLDVAFAVFSCRLGWVSVFSRA